MSKSDIQLKNVLKTIKMQESTISMILGVLVVLLVGGFVIQYLTKNKVQETLPDLSIQEVTPLPTTHRVSDGESLWSISEQYYGAGYNWVDIKEANEITNADELTEGQELAIPYVTPRIADARVSSVVETTTAPTGAPTQAPSDTPTPEPTKETPEEITKPEPQEKTNTDREYTITPGDSLWKIAEKYYNDGNKWIEIAKANNLDNPSLLTSNKTIIIPNVLAAEETAIQEKTANVSEDNNTLENDTKYTVEPGDSLWSIAEKAYGNGEKWTEIAKANNLSHPSLIHHGNELTIPR